MKYMDSDSKNIVYKYRLVAVQENNIVIQIMSIDCKVIPFLQSLFKLGLMTSRRRFYLSPFLLNCRLTSANISKLYFII